jgi:membrane-bound lytic murein transglycosylase A
MIIRFAALFLMVVLMTSQSAAKTIRHSVLNYSELAGWKEDDHTAALDVFRKTCPLIRQDGWSPICAAAFDARDGRTFFELFFRPVLIEDGSNPLFTGYFEPEVKGSLNYSERYKYPVYKTPPNSKESGRYFTRAQIMAGKLRGRDLEIAWVEDPVDFFFLQVQGSGRIKLPSGDYIRIGYAGSNGHPYRSVGQELVRRGIYQEHQVSAQVIRNWVGRNLKQGLALLNHNKSYVFFREVSHIPAHLGPVGAMNRSITQGRSIAVDPKFVTLGAPVWLEKGGPEPIHRLMIAQDTGSAIKGAQRADLFMGTGDVSGRTAGRMRDGGRMVVLLPVQYAFGMTPEAVK